MTTYAKGNCDFGSECPYLAECPDCSHCGLHCYCLEDEHLVAEEMEDRTIPEPPEEPTNR